MGEIRIGYNLGIGIRAVILSNIAIGKHVMLGLDVTIYGSNHMYNRTDILMTLQGFKKYPLVIIEDDVWIGGHAIINVGRTIKKGTTIAARGCRNKRFPRI